MKTKNIYDIAKELNVAPSTVSKVLNNSVGVSHEKQQQIMKYVKEIGYVPSASARSLKSKVTWTIGVVFSEDMNVGLEHPFFSSVFQNFKQYVEKEGYEISFIVQRLGKHTMSYLDWCRNKKVDGVFIVVGSIKDKGISELIESNIKCVSTDLVHEKLYSVISNNYQGVDMAINYLVDRGYQKIGTIPGPLFSSAFLERFQAYQKIMKEKGLLIDPNHVVEAESFGFTSGYNAVRKMIENSSELPEAIIVGSDDICTGVIRGVESMGYNVPDDIAVIGFDDVAYAKLVSPSLTTIQQNKKEIGETAAKILIDLMQRKSNEHPRLTKIPVELVVRNSTNKAKNYKLL